MNRGYIADLVLLRTLLAVHQKSQEPSFWEVIDSFVLLAYMSLAASVTACQLQWDLNTYVLDGDTDMFSKVCTDSMRYCSTSYWLSQ